MKRADRMRSRAAAVTAPSPQEPLAPPQAQPAMSPPEQIEPPRQAGPVLVRRTPDEEALAQIAKSVKGMDWASVAGYAQKAIAKGHLTEQQIDAAIDAALPDPKRAATLPLHRLLAVASAASPGRKQEYAAAIRQYPGLDRLPPEARGQIDDHLQMIGLGDNNAFSNA